MLLYNLELRDRIRENVEDILLNQTDMLVEDLAEQVASVVWNLLNEELDEGDDLIVSVDTPVRETSETL